MEKEYIKVIIGRREKVDFAELGIFGITAKIDTGAYTSVLHCSDIKEENSKLYFKLLDSTHPEYNEQVHEFEAYFKKDFKNSFGESETRYVIKTIVKIGHKRIKALISLTDRGTMRYPVLLGRRFLKNKFIVDVSLINHLSEH
jgi:hypothetical protein